MVYKKGCMDTVACNSTLLAGCSKVKSCFGEPCVSVIFNQISGGSWLAIKVLRIFGFPGSSYREVTPKSRTLFFNNKMTDAIEHQEERARGLVGYDVALTWRRS